jgi:acetoin utilization protein AcuB
MKIAVEEFTSPVLVTIDAEASLDEVFNLMQSNHIRHVPVKLNEKIVGIISERDVLSHIGKDWAKMVKASDIMSTDLLTVYQNESIGRVAYMLSNSKIGSALVLDENDQVWGIFTTTDALNALVEVFYDEANERSEFKELT